MGKINVPSITGINFENIPQGLITFLQTVQDALTTIDKNAVYKDAINTGIITPRVRALKAQGQGFSVSNVNVASAEDYAALVIDMRSLVLDVNDLRNKVDQLEKQIKGTQ